MTKYSTQRPYLASFVILRNNQGKIAFLLRQNTGWMDGKYGLPSGKVEIDEMYKAAAVREAFEEVGIKIKEEDLRFAITQHFHEPKDQANNWVNVIFEVEKWEGEPVNNETEKHGELKWFALSELPANIVPPVKQALTEYAKGNKYCEFIWEE